MTALPPLFVEDSVRALTISLWGTMMGLSLVILWYAALIRRCYYRLRSMSVAFLSVFWHVLGILVTVDTMATEISWKIIFLGVGKAVAGPWTYPNVGIYLIGCTAYVMVLMLERKRYVRAKLLLGVRERNGVSSRRPD